MPSGTTYLKRKYREEYVTETERMGANLLSVEKEKLRRESVAAREVSNVSREESF